MNACENVTPAIAESRNPSGLNPSVLTAPVSQLNLLPSKEEVAEDQPSVLQERIATKKRWWVPTIWHESARVRAARRIPHIVHVKVDELFASVEQVLNPKLRGKAVLVGRGVVASASSEAKLQGVKAGMKLIDAVRLCPKAIVVPGQYEHYAEFAERLRRILETYTPAVETAALDDFYLDFAGSGRVYADFEGTLGLLQAEVLGRTGLNVAVGAGRTKVVASIASRLDRPGGLRIVPPGTEETFLAPLPVEMLHSIGRAHAGALADYGVATIGQLRRIPKPVLAEAFGAEVGKQMWERARGLDGRESPTATACVLRETKIEGGTIDRELLGGLLEYLSERICAALREQGKQGGIVGVRVRYVDHASAQQSMRLVCPTNDERELRLAAKELFAKVVAPGVAVYQVAVSVTNLESGRRDKERFGTQESRRRHANRELGSVRSSYGWDAVLQGS
jgi:DNA polymerase IV